MLDAQGFSLLAEEDHHPRKRELLALLKVYERAGFIAGISVVTVAEERRTGAAGQRLDWWRSQLVRVPVSESTSLLARQLLEETGLDGHRGVVDALVVATAASSPDVARVISSDAGHIPKLCAAATAFRRIPVEFKQV
ncbi:type II toxin-antitoxin system VapC family toxin [Nonomuraea sp. H19]|uniref:type II toxin-antitoxin system VapC family toxin n=1 Tax=Nonomuraea sp. H19 TaxID=3452206 RepID=UPI003F8C1C86